MSVATSLFLIAAGAILRYAVTADLAGIDLQTVGLILLIVGVLGLLISVGFMIAQSQSARRDTAIRRDDDPYRDDPYR